MPQTASLNAFIIAAHFREPLSLSVVDFAHWAFQKRDHFPDIEQGMATARIIMDEATVTQVIEPSSGPRLTLTSPNSNWTLILQDDRFAIGWSRSAAIGASTDYPGYLAMKAFWRQELADFLRWHDERLGSRPLARVTEIAYTNVVPLEHNDEKIRIQDVVRYIDLHGRKINFLNMSWGEALTSDLSGAKVHAQVTVGPANALAPGALDTRRSVLFAFVGLSPADGPLDGASVSDGIEALHSRILEMYEAAIIFPR